MIPVDLTRASDPTPSIPQRRSNSPHGYLNDNSPPYSESTNPPRPVSSYVKRSVPEIPSTIYNRPMSAQSTDRTVNELRVNLSSPPPYQQQKKVTLQIDENSPEQQQQRVTR